MQLWIQYSVSLTRRNKPRGRQFDSTFQLLVTFAHWKMAVNLVFSWNISSGNRTKVEHNGNPATFTNFRPSIDKRKFIYKMFDKQDVSNFHIVTMPWITSRIPCSISESSTERIARVTLLLKGFLDVTKNIIWSNYQLRWFQTYAFKTD